MCSPVQLVRFCLVSTCWPFKFLYIFKRISGSQSLEISVLLFLHLIIICVFIFFISFSLFFHLKNDHHFFSFWFVRLDADGFAIRLVVLFLFCSFSSLFPSAFYILGGEGKGGEGSRGRGEGRGGRGERRGNPATWLAWLDPGLCKKKTKIGKLQFSSSFFHFVIICLSFFYHFSSFLLPVVQKFCKKWKIAIFLEFFSLFYHFFIMFHHFCFQWCKNFPKKWKIAIFLEFFFIF